MDNWFEEEDFGGVPGQVQLVTEIAEYSLAMHSCRVAVADMHRRFANLTCHICWHVSMGHDSAMRFTHKKI